MPHEGKEGIGSRWRARDIDPMRPSKNEGREIRTPNLLIWSQTRCRCAIPPLLYFAEHFEQGLKLNGASFAAALQLSLVKIDFKETEDYQRARGVVVSHPLSMREALGSIPSVSIFAEEMRGR